MEDYWNDFLFNIPKFTEWWNILPQNFKQVANLKILF